MTLRSCPRALWAIVALQIAVGIAYSVLFPTFRGPDESHHVDLSLAVADTWAYPDFDERFLSLGVRNATVVAQFKAGSRDLTAADAPSRLFRPSFEDGGFDRPSEERNPIAQHPPLYYVAMGAVVDVADATPLPLSAYDRVVGVLRLATVPLMAAVTVAAFLSARLLGGSEATGLAAALVPLSVPQFNHIGSVVNNDGLFVALTAVLGVVVLRIAGGDLDRPTAVVAGALLGLALLTKGFALVLLPWVGLAYAVGAGRDQRRAATVRLIQAAAIAMAAGGWWWIRNLVVHDRLRPALQRLDRPDDVDVDVAFWLERYVGWMAQRFWGWFGWFDVRMSLVVIGVATALLLGLIALGGWRRPPGKTVVALYPFVALLMSVGYQGFVVYRRTGVTPGIQGRYLFGALAALAALAALGLERLAKGRGWAPLAVLGAAVALNAVAVRTILDHYWGGEDASLVDRLRALGAWSPWPGWVTALLGAALVASAVGTVLALWRFETAEVEGA